ncbi:uncharacterized protein LOC142225252 [Haematobia irritans]|uniref:uncharacterized protein LOC142225252 n=1 Tax=Haematobia irritans TaxID=7368 RepID=UPI003F508707
MQQTKVEALYGIRWNIRRFLFDIDYADDICLFVHRFEDIEKKLQVLSRNAKAVGLKIKTKLMRIGGNNDSLLSLDGQIIEDVETFSNLGTTITKDGGSHDDISGRINKARNAFHSLQRVWRANNISKDLKLKNFDSSVKSVLLYDCSTWNTTQNSRRKLQSFHNKCLKQALEWNSQGHRNPGRPRNTWIRMVKAECTSLNMTWNQVKALAKDRTMWREFVGALCSIRTFNQILKHTAKFPPHQMVEIVDIDFVGFLIFVLRENGVWEIPLVSSILIASIAIIIIVG